MSSTIAEEQAATVQPPRKNEVFALSIDSTARSYSLGSLSFGGVVAEQDSHRRLETWLTLQADGGDVFYSLSTAAQTIDDTAAIAVGAAISATATHCAKIAADDRHEFRIDRSRDVFLNVKTASGTGILRFWVSSNPGA